jgi:hypothetical protein
MCKEAAAAVYELESYGKKFIFYYRRPSIFKNARRKDILKSLWWSIFEVWKRRLGLSMLRSCGQNRTCNASYIIWQVIGL